MSLIADLVCRHVYAACVYAVFTPLPQTVSTLEPADVEQICAEVMRADRSGEVVSVKVGPLVLRSGKFGPEIFLVGDGVVHGFIRHQDPDIGDHCAAFLRGVFDG